MLWVLAAAGLELRAGCAGRKELSQQLDSCSKPSPSLHTADKNFISHVLFFMAGLCSVIRAGPELAGSRICGFEGVFLWPLRLACQGWEERADRNRKAALPGKAD